MAKKQKKTNSAEKPPKTAYSEEFRETAIKLALAGEKSIADVARELELPEWKLYGWVQSWKKKKNSKETSNSKGSSDDELRRLQKRNRELEQEVEILKKAAAYFAKTLL